MADHEINEKKNKYNSNEKKSLLKGLELTNLEISEEEITGDVASQLYNILFKQERDLKKMKLIKEALKLFPEPDKSKELKINI